MPDTYRALNKIKNFKRLLTGLLSGLIFSGILIYGAYYNLNREKEISQWTLHAQEEIYQIERTISLVKDFETGSRGVLLTNKDEYEQPLKEASKNLSKVLAHLKKLSSDDLIQKSHYDSLFFYLNQKVAFSTSVIRLRQEQGPKIALQLFQTNEGLEYMDKIRHFADLMLLHEKDVLEQRKMESEKASSLTNLILSCSLLFFVLLLMYMVYKGWKQENEKEKAVQKLKEREEHFRALIENNSEAIVLKDIKESIIYWSPGAEKILGWTAEEAAQPGFSTLVHPEDRKRIQLQKEQIAANPSLPVKGTQRVLHKNGHYVWIEGETMNLLHQSSVHAIVSNFKDVSDRVAADLKVQEAHALLEKSVSNLNQIMDSSIDVICTIDALGRFAQVSAASAAVWGYPHEELTGKAFMDFVSDQDKELTKVVAISIMAGNPVTTFENYYVRPDGSLVPVLWSAQWSEKDQLMYCIAKDATEKKKLEKAFHLEQQRFNDLFMQAPSAICVLKGADHRFVSSNPLYNQLVGSNRIILGRTAQQAFPELIDQGFLTLLDQVYTSGEPFIGKEQLIQLDKEGNGNLTDIYANVVYQAYTNSLGEVEGIYFFGVDVTEQVLAKKKVEESEGNFRKLIEDLPAAVYTCTTDGQIKLFNRAAVELWGREPETEKDLWCGSWKTYDCNGHSLALEDSPMAATLKHEKPALDQEIIIERPNGERRYVKPHPVLSYNAAGDLIGGINILTDITESKNASEQIRRSETALAEAQRIAKIGSWSMDLLTQDLSCSKELYKVFDTDKEQFTGTFTSFLAFVNESDQANAWDTTYKAAYDGKPFEVEYNITTGKGENRIIHVIGSTQADDQGEVVRLFGTAQDITERKEFENALLASEEKYKLLFYQAPLPKWIYDLETLRILDVNESAIMHYGYSREEFLQLTAQDLRPEEDVPALLNSLLNEETGKGVYRLGLWNHLKKDGTLIKVEISAHALDYENRNCLLVEANDVTEKVKAEQAVKESNNRWEMLSKVTFDAIWEWDLKSNELICGVNYKTLFGQNLSDNKEDYQAWDFYLHPDDRQRVNESLKAFLKSGESTWQEEYRKLNSKGEYAYCTDRAILIRDGHNEPVRMIGALRDVTESKLAAENLLIEKNFSEALLEATPDGIVGFNEKGEIIIFNKKAESLFSYTQEEIIGASLTKLLPSDTHVAHLDRRENFFSNPTESQLQASSREMIGVRKNGSEFPVDVRLNLLHSYKGRIVISSIRDITQRKRAETQLRESEKNLKAILSSSQEGIYLLDTNCQLVLLNEHAQDIILRGYGVNCKPGDHFPSLFDTELNGKLEVIFEKVLAGDKWESERNIPLLEGMAHYHSVYFPVRDKEGNIIGICCSSKDITEKKKIEEAIKVAQAEKEEYQYRFKAILDYSPQAILIKDLEGKYIFSNKAFLKLFDLDRNNEVGQQLKEVFEDQITRAEFLANAPEVDSDIILTKEWSQQIHLPDGNILDMEILKFPLYDQQKRLFGICTICKDITEQMKHQQQLIEARENAEQAERLQEQFLANMSHELRTPMNGIIGMVNLLLTSSSLQPDQKGRLQVIQRSSDTLLSLINDILDLSKIKAGMLTIDKVNFDFNESIAGTALLFKEKAKEKGIKLTVTSNPFIPRLLAGDPHRLNQILNNLLSNAIKFTEKGFVRLEASLQSETEDQVVVEFVVSDSGIGMEAANLLYIFDNFAQASTDISSKYGGTGLGLAITKRLVEMQGGEISVASTKGIGTSFTFHLPFSITQDTNMVVKPYYQTAHVPLKKDYSGKRALIVEDNDINQAVLASSLKQHHMDLQIANNGQEAIDLLETGEHFDIIFMDLRMPVMNGFQATAYIRQKLHKQVPIVVLTASVLRNERNRCLEIGASDYMAKPFAMADLARTLEQFVSKEEQISEPATEPIITTDTPFLSHAQQGAEFDISRLMELEDPEYIRHIFTLFTDKVPTYLQELKNNSLNGNWEDFLEKTHKIRGSLSSVQIDEIYGLILSIEEKVREEKTLSGLEHQLDKCLSIYNQLIPSIYQEVEKQLVPLEADL
ncbi:PAS domain S-box protein [Rufibacter tibetensis]|uniref:Sensory/regulatory protein RpfC n=1 Tax=Rufibacter tibetensis TaxID=512763 RepID=A0A0P0CUH9_9BACT|nr:PAS domain S-box protein [Rufibacter tibetensis]ALI98009.1 hypothetical protein DC20_02235 [Rufibacter tibetensis]